MKSELMRFKASYNNLSQSLTLANSFGFLRKSGRGWQKLKKVCGIFFDIAVVVEVIMIITVLCISSIVVHFVHSFRQVTN